ncbi:hypothetical protein C7271_18720 [filamentous cyanobacterium CCP5]|nr:hypothetical protein C7271_18720 [filamentous cyanobacterium CCP5]
MFQRMAERAYPLDSEAQNLLKRRQQKRGLSDETAAMIEERVLQANDFLHSEKGLDYRKLRNLLKARDFKAADRETYEVMIRAVGESSGSWFTENELLRFPAADLLTIDRLWVKYSNGRFGFSVQKQIYKGCGAELDGNYPGGKIWRQFAAEVGWRVNDSYIDYKEVTFDTSAPRGHLPLLCGSGDGWLVGWGWLLFSRMETCRV